jgi:hypothetical protein
MQILMNVQPGFRGKRGLHVLGLLAAACGLSGGIPSPARAEVETVTVRLEEARCFS